MSDDLRIYNIDELVSDAYAKVQVDPETGEITGGEELDAILQQGAEKILSCGRYLAVRARDLEAMKAHVKSMQSRIKAEERSQQWLKTMMIKAVKALNTTSVESTDIVIKLKKLPPSVFVEDETKIPDTYVKRETKTVESVDLRGILADIKAGKEVAGCSIHNGFRVEIK